MDLIIPGVLGLLTIIGVSAGRRYSRTLFVVIALSLAAGAFLVSRMMPATSTLERRFAESLEPGASDAEFRSVLFKQSVVRGTVYGLLIGTIGSAIGAALPRKSSTSR
jgi:hypothetical protein